MKSIYYASPASEELGKSYEGFRFLLPPARFSPGPIGLGGSKFSAIRLQVGQGPLPESLLVFQLKYALHVAW